MQRSFAIIVLLLGWAGLILLGGCGGGGTSSPTGTSQTSTPGSLTAGATPTPNPGPTPQPTPTATPAATPSSTPVPANVTVIANIQSLPGWESCVTPACAGGLGSAVSNLTQNLAVPSLSGNSAQFTLGGSVNYSDALWWKQLTPDPSHTQFRYDLWVYVSDPNLPEALEFDVNQTLNNTRYIFGTECSFKNSKKWDVWDGGTARWIPSSANCTPFPANAWTHIVWNFERVSGQVHYIDVTVNNITQSVNMYLNPLANINASEINVAVQLDGDYQQDPFSIWIDKVTLSHW